MGRVRQGFDRCARAGMSAETRGGNAWDRWRQRVRCLYGGKLDGMLDIFWALNLGSLGTTRALFCRGYGTSSVGCLPEKIISRKAAEARRGKSIILTPLRQV
jgi:hypothetical protein